MTTVSPASALAWPQSHQCFAVPTTEVDGAADVMLGLGVVILFHSFEEPSPSCSKKTEGLPKASRWLSLSAHAALRGAERDG